MQAPQNRPRAVFVYHNPRDKLLAEIAAERAPDTGLIGMNHLRDMGIDARVHSPRAQQKQRAGGLRARVAWTLRELPLAWQLNDADVACSFWTRAFPLAARLRGRPAVVGFNVGLCTTYLRISRPRQRLMRAALRSMAGVVCFASAQRDQLIRQHGLAPERVHTVLFGADERFYRPEQPSKDGYVLAVGRDMARDYGTFAKAVGKLDARAIIVASERNVAGLDLPRNVELRLDVSHKELRELYAGAACVSIPTRREGYPYGADCSGQTVLLDAMAMGRPVVASERATLSDYIESPETALTVPPEDASQLRSAFERVLGDEQLAATMGASGRRLVEEKFTTKHVAARLVPIIRGAAAR